MSRSHGAQRVIACCKELLKHVKNMKTMESLEKSLPNHWMASFFRIDVFIQLRQYQKALSLLKETQKIFPQSVFFYASVRNQDDGCRSWIGVFVRADGEVYVSHGGVCPCADVF